MPRTARTAVKLAAALILWALMLMAAKRAGENAVNDGYAISISPL